ncbi:very short patch repair endonuclease [Streptomyces sp. NPDC059853]|uniref:very short patch repair endonuclease n=1 Tax=Streptomyces sp. NPDC059853 TaxID=3346973 RepID=UPI003666F6A3
MAHSAGLATTEKVPPDSWASSPETRAVMKANKGRDTKPERLLRSALHRRGLRFRVETKPLPQSRGTVDVLFPKARVAVFVDGCFWHGCPEHHRPSTKRSEFWTEKIKDNRARDIEMNAALRAEGWEVVRVWEHEDPQVAADRVTEAIRQRLGGNC